MPNAILNKRCAGNPYPNIGAQFVAASTQRLTIADNASLSLGADTDYTWALWVQFTTLGADRGIVSKYNNGAGSTIEHLIRFVIGAGRIDVNIGNGTTSTNVLANNFGAPTVNTWLFLVAQHDSTADTIGVSVNNGTFNTAAWANGTQDTAHTLTLGAQTSGAVSPFDGLLDSVGFWKRVLTAAEIAALYKGGVGMAYRDLTTDMKTSLISWWNFDGTFNDSHGTNNLTNNNGVSFTGGKR